MDEDMKRLVKEFALFMAGVAIIAFAVIPFSRYLASIGEPQSEWVWCELLPPADFCTSAEGAAP